MQSQKVRRWFRNWQGILMEERVNNDIDMSHVKSHSRLDNFKNWQGIDVSGMDFSEQQQHDTVKNELGTQFVVVTPATSKAEMELRRCFKNWQGIYLGFMDFEQVVCDGNEVVVETRDVGTGPEPVASTGFKKPNLIKSDNVQLTYQSLDPFGHSSPTPTRSFSTVTSSSKIKSPPIHEVTSIEPCQKEEKVKKKRCTSDFNTKIPTHVQHSFSTPAKSEDFANTELLQENHKQFLIEYVDSHPTAVLNEAFQSFTKKFDGFLVKKSTIQSFIKDQCTIKVLETDYSSNVQKSKRTINSKINVQFRHDWTNAWSQTDIDFTANCVFIERVQLNVVMKSGGLPTKRPELKVTPRYFFVAMSTCGIVETQMFHPAVKREDPYVAFVEHVLNQMDKVEKKSKYVVMSGMHDWLLDDLEEIVQDRGYQCVYLPPSAAGLNPITEFWKVVKYGIRRQYLFEGETIADRINESRHHVPKEKVEEFIQYAKLYFNRCLNKPVTAALK
ncbi:hypothetical protein EDC94DRAFT_398505 [Helicostylum pulchrum]|nr:hypothetical protein EDC94DRAFT_398505 [Helicostylum pulchrum]